MRVLSSLLVRASNFVARLGSFTVEVLRIPDHSIYFRLDRVFIVVVFRVVRFLLLLTAYVLVLCVSDLFADVVLVACDNTSQSLYLIWIC